MEKGLEETLRYVSMQKDHFEIIVVEDGSTDNTRKILKEYQQEQKIKLLIHKENLGKGAAVRTGVLAAKGDFFLVSDIDLSVPLETLGKFLLELNQGFDLVIGSRRVAGSEILAHQNPLRENLGHFFTKLSNLILGTDYSDFTCGFKLLTQEAAKKIFSKQKLNGWAFDSEVLFLAKKWGFRVSEVGVKWTDIKFSKVRFPQDIIKSLLGLFKIRWYNFKDKYN